MTTDYHAQARAWLRDNDMHSTDGAGIFKIAKLMKEYEERGYERGRSAVITRIALQSAIDHELKGDRGSND